MKTHTLTFNSKGQKFVLTSDEPIINITVSNWDAMADYQEKIKDLEYRAKQVDEHIAKPLLEMQEIVQNNPQAFGNLTVGACKNNAIIRFLKLWVEIHKVNK